MISSEEIIKPMNVKIVLLKEPPNRQHLYRTSDAGENLFKKADHSKSICSDKVNKRSIAYLSSILQDENTFTEDRTITSFDSYRPKLGDKVKQFMTKGKLNHRYLSCLLESDNRGDEEQHHSKTEGIEKLLLRKKVMPIDKLKQRRKNIKFSAKNKQQLNTQFKNFVENNEQKIYRQKGQQAAEPQLVESTVYCKRRADEKKYLKLKAVIQQQSKQKMTERLQAHQTQQDRTYRPDQQRQSVLGFAVEFRRINRNLPVVKKFDWSKLNEHSFQLVSN